MPPPISRASATFSKFSTTSILSLTFAPPRIATNGRAGLLSALPRYANSFSISNPAAACCTNRVIPTTEACARCAEPNASHTNNPSHRAANCLENASSFFSSSGWNRTFSSTSTSPSISALLCASTPGPTQSSPNATGLPSNSSNFFAAGCSEYFGSGPPFGRPRCEASTSRPPFSMASFNVGSVSRIRVSSVTTPSFNGTLKSTRIKTRFPRKSKSLIVSLFIFLSWERQSPDWRVGTTTPRLPPSRYKIVNTRSASTPYFYSERSRVIDLCNPHLPPRLYKLVIPSGAGRRFFFRVRSCERVGLRSRGIPLARWLSLTRAFDQSRVTNHQSLELRRQQLDQIPAPAGVCPLVVVPRQYFHALVADHFGVLRIHDRRIRIAFEVRGNQFLLGVAEDPLHRAVGRGFQRRVHRFFRRRLLHKHRQVHHADVRRRHPHCIPIKLALQIRQHQVQRLRRSCRTRNHADRGGTRSPQVLVRQIEQFLIVGVGVNGGHGAAMNPKRFMQNLGHRRQTIRGA